jgi:pimeloyl-ACP methyl ester carboxylesterase
MPRSARGLNYVTTDLRPPWRTSGLPVVFNHGIGTNLEIWSEWVPIVAARHPVVRFDLRGFAGSPVPPADHRWTMDEMVEDLLDVAATSGAGKVHVVGESVGGTIALAAAIKAPERFASVAISNASHRGSGVTNIQGWRSTFESQGNAAWNAGMMTSRFYPGAAEPSALAWFSEMQEKSDRHAVLALAALLAGADLSEALRSFKVPLSITLPDSSPFIAPSHGAEMRALVPNSRLRIVPYSKHGLPFSHARTEAEALVAFLAEIEAGSAA